MIVIGQLTQFLSVIIPESSTGSARGFIAGLLPAVTPLRFLSRPLRGAGLRCCTAAGEPQPVSSPGTQADPGGEHDRGAGGDDYRAVAGEEGS